MWEMMENVNSGHDLYFDLFGWVEVGRKFWSFVAATGIFVKAVCSHNGLRRFDRSAILFSYEQDSATWSMTTIDWRWVWYFFQFLSLFG